MNDWLNIDTLKMYIMKRAKGFKKYGLCKTVSEFSDIHFNEIEDSSSIGVIATQPNLDIFG